MWGHIGSPVTLLDNAFSYIGLGRCFSPSLIGIDAGALFVSVYLLGFC